MLRIITSRTDLPALVVCGVYPLDLESKAAQQWALGCLHNPLGWGIGEAW